MKQSAAEILREYGPFPGAARVNGVTFDGQQVWCASGDKLNAFDPASGNVLRSIDVASHAGTAFDGQHLFQIAEDRIQKIDPHTGQVVATIPAPGGGSDSGLAWAEGTLWVGQDPGPQDTSDRSRNRGDPAHHRLQPLRHRGHLGGRRTLARNLGRRRERIAADRSRDGRSPGKSRDAAWNRRVGTRIRWRRPVLLRRRRQREGQSSTPAPTRLPAVIASSDRLERR